MLGNPLTAPVLVGLALGFGIGLLWAVAEKLASPFGFASFPRLLQRHGTLGAVCGAGLALSLVIASRLSTAPARAPERPRGPAPLVARPRSVAVPPPSPTPAPTPAMPRGQAAVVAQPSPAAGGKALEKAPVAAWVVSPENRREFGHAGYRIRRPEIGLELVYVPEGRFRMGSEHGRDNEQPVHEVELDAYWIGRTEVTVGQWRRVMGRVPEWNSQGEDHPVVNVRVPEVQEFCRRVGLRLPTEAEWEYAARGPDGYTYPWGNGWDEARVLNDRAVGPFRRTYPVEALPQGVSWCGALGLAGNVAELCSDWYAEDYYARSPRRNPPGPTEGEATPIQGRLGDALAPGKGPVLRGGPIALRGAARDGLDPHTPHLDFGFRVARRG